MYFRRFLAMVIRKYLVLLIFVLPLFSGCSYTVSHTRYQSGAETQFKTKWGSDRTDKDIWLYGY
jgi:uncharacterized protein YceK